MTYKILLSIFCRGERKKKKEVKNAFSSDEILCPGSQAAPPERRAGRNHPAAVPAIRAPNYLSLSSREILNWHNFVGSSGCNSRCDPMPHLCPVCQNPKPGARGSPLLPRGMLCRTAPDKDLGAAAPASRPTPAADQQVWLTRW